MCNLCAVVLGRSITNDKYDIKNDNSPYSFTIGRVSFLVNLDVYLLSHIVLVLLF